MNLFYGLGEEEYGEDATQNDNDEGLEEEERERQYNAYVQRIFDAFECFCLTWIRT